MLHLKTILTFKANLFHLFHHTQATTKNELQEKLRTKTKEEVASRPTVPLINCNYPYCYASKLKKNILNSDFL